MNQRRQTKTRLPDKPTSGASARYSYDGLDRIFHERARLGLVTCLAREEVGLSFVELKQLCDLTDGNLSRHLSQLSEAGFVKLHRKDSGRKAKTTVHLTKQGRQAFANYLDELDQVLNDAKATRRAKSKSKRSLAFDG